MKGLHLHRRNKGRLIHFAEKLILGSREGIENDTKFIVNLILSSKYLDTSMTSDKLGKK